MTMDLVCGWGIATIRLLLPPATFAQETAPSPAGVAEAERAVLGPATRQSAF
jgi:hypothetical protein